MYAQGERNTAYSRVTEKFQGAAWRCMPRALIITLQLILFSFHFISFFSGAVAAAAEQLRRCAHGNAFRCVLIARIVLCYYFSLLIRCRMFERNCRAVCSYSPMFARLNHTKFRVINNTLAYSAFDSIICFAVR